MPTYSDSEMRAIMGRALQIDSGRSERFTPEQLRTIATELGISTQALEVAMYEADSKGKVANPSMPGQRPMPGWAKGVAIGVAIFVVTALGLGFLSRAVVRERAAAPRPVVEGEIAPARPATAAPTPASPTKVAPAAEPRVKTTTKRAASPPQ